MNEFSLKDSTSFFFKNTNWVRKFGSIFSVSEYSTSIIRTSVKNDFDVELVQLDHTSLF